MIKAIFLDLDETLCDTKNSDVKALKKLKEALTPVLDNEADIDRFADIYINGVYKRLTPSYEEQLLPVVDEGRFRLSLIHLILTDFAVKNVDDVLVQELQHTFDQARQEAFDFYPGLRELLLSWRNHFKLAVITNGPEFSQLKKIKAVNLRQLVDHVIIGGQEKEEKPAVSIFNKALALCDVEAKDVIHIGDKLTTDIVGANNAGIQSVWVSHGQQRDNQEAIKPDYILNHPREMGDFIAGLTK